jgi:sporulation protein YqfC
MEDIAERFDLPAETAAGLPRITITGDSRVLIENHKGLLEYSDELIQVSGGRVRVRISGQGLLLRAMDGEMLLISGKIFAVELE